MSLEEYAAKLLVRYNRPHEIVLEPRHSALSEGTAEAGWSKAADLGLIPNHFFNDPRRLYAEDTKVHIKRFDRPKELPYPSSFESIYAVISRSQSMLQAESHAREFASRLIEWESACDDNVVWYFIRHPMDYIAYLGKPYNSAVDAVSWSLPGFEKIQDTVKSMRLPFLVKKSLAAYEAWEQATRKNVPINHFEYRLTIGGHSLFSSLPNPFLPLLNLWETGHLTFSSFDDTDKTIRMYTTLFGSMSS